jgi:putative ABC transport system permease protein
VFHQLFIYLKQEISPFFSQFQLSSNPSVINVQHHYNGIFMFRSYLSVAIRSLLKRRTNAIINIAGLALGIAAAIVIVVFARYELSYDKHHENFATTYMVYKERITPAGVQATYDTWVPLAGRLESEIPEITLGTRVNQEDIGVEVNHKRYEEECYYIDASYFELFDFPLVSGDNDKPFANPNTVIISQEIAQKYFGDADPIGQEITVNFNRNYIVSGILEKYPQNGFIGAEILLPIESIPDFQELETEWGSSFLLSFVKLAEGTDVESVEAKFPQLITNIWDEEAAQRTNFKLLPLGECYDTFVGDSRDSYALLYIALGILLIAVFNFMNLSTARSMERAREIGMRKVLGAARSQLVTQFMFEAIIMSLAGLILGVLIAEVTLPFMYTLFDMQLVIPYFSEPMTIPALLLFGLGVGILAGSYPAFFLSGFPVLESLGSSFSRRFAGLGVRNGLVVVQFAISVVLIVGALTISEQIGFMKDTELSFNKENLLVIPVNERDFEDREEARIKLATFRTELASYNGISHITSSRHVPGRWSGSNLFVRPEGWEGDPLRMRYTYMDANFFDSYQVDMIEGPGFLPDSEGDQRLSVVLNQAALKAFGWEDIESKSIVLGGRKVAVVGMISDFNYESLRNEVDPILHFHRVPSNAAHRYMTVRTSRLNLNNTLAFIESKWNILDHSRPFSYFFIDDDMAELYANEDRMLTMVKIFSFLSIFISCLGLYGLLSFILDKRRKEIGIKRVLGASIAGITISISNEFSRLVIISVVIATPVAYLAINDWLEEFAYRIDLGWSVFLLTLVLSLGLAWSTVAFKAIRAASANPALSIRDE